MGMMNALRRLQLPELSAHGISFPSLHEANWLTQSVKHSPDLGYLEQYEFQLLFSPDDTRVGYSHYSLISESVALCGGYTEKTYAYWSLETNKFRTPIPIRQDGEPVLRYMAPSLKIKGDVQAVRTWQFRQLDDYKKNKEQFRRQRVNILVPFHKMSNGNIDDNGQELPRALQDKGYLIKYPERVYVLRCWMYVGISEYWDDLLDAGFRGFKPVPHYEARANRPWLKEYYDFPRKPL